MGLSKDFTGLSELLLGQAQPAQFQSSGQTGYWWGSKVSDDGNWTALSAVTNNANAEIPRTYTRDTDMYYNWYAAIAESADSKATNRVALDSVCPAGWQLPGTTESGNSYSTLLHTVYGFTVSTATDTKKLPISLVWSGSINWADGTYINKDRYGYYWTSVATTRGENGIRTRAFLISASSFDTTLSVHRGNGYSVRCIQK